MKRQTKLEWFAEGTERYGNIRTEWRFKCPKCATEASVQEFKSLGQNASVAMTNCIGRFHKTIGCKWTVDNPLGTVGKGRIIYEGDESKEVFDFA